MDYEPFSVNQTLDAFLGGTAPDRVIMGVPYYGWHWRTVSNKPHAATLPATARDDCAGCLLLWREACFDDRQSLTGSTGSSTNAASAVSASGPSISKGTGAELYQALRDGFGAPR